MRLPTLLACMLLTACSSRDGGPREGSALVCVDGVDNDSDGARDCDDADCLAFEVCATSIARDGGQGVDLGFGDFGVPACVDALDVVFVLDVSTSMADDLDRIRQGLGEIWDAARALTPSARFGMVVFVDDVLAVQDCAPYATLQALQAAFDHWRDACDDDVNPVSGLPTNDCPENSLDALYVAATMCPWRNPSTRIVVHVTDDTFAERPDRLSTLPVARDYDETVAALRSAQIRVGAFATPSGQATWWCSGDTTGEGFFEDWNGSASIPAATGGRAWSIVETRAGRIDMGAAITELVTEEFCTLY